MSAPSVSAASPDKLPDMLHERDLLICKFYSFFTPFPHERDLLICKFYSPPFPTFGRCL